MKAIEQEKTCIKKNTKKMLPRTKEIKNTNENKKAMGGAVGLPKTQPLASFDRACLFG